MSSTIVRKYLAQGQEKAESQTDSALYSKYTRDRNDDGTLEKKILLMQDEK